MRRAATWQAEPGYDGAMRLAILMALALTAMVPSIGGITYTCDSSLSVANGFPSDICAMLNGAQAAGVYDSIFSNMSASIYIQYAGGGLAGSDVALNDVSYSAYLSALSAQSNSPAWQSLAPTEPLLYGGDDVAISSSLAAALGFGGALAGMTATGASCTFGTPGCYSGVITIGSSANPIYFPPSPGSPTSAGWDFFSLVEHETDEILGTISCIGTSNGAPYVQCVDGSGNSYVAPADLFRYAAPGTLSWVGTANGSIAYFSIDGGKTAINYYNNSPNNEDYGDWSGGCFVQSASACQSVNMDISTDGGSEVALLNAVGFNTVPEPGTMGLVGASVVALAAWGARRGR